jgi:hypothetical protein
MYENKDPFAMHNTSFSMEKVNYEEALITFHDPFTGEILDPDKPPSSFEDQPELKQGLDYLRLNGSRINITIFGAPHGDEAVHANGDLRSAFEAHDSIFLEGLSHTQKERDLVWDLSAGNVTQPSSEQLDGFGEYGKRKIEALKGVTRPVFFADIPADGNDYEQSLHQWSQLFDRLHAKDNVTGVSRDKDVELATAINLTGTTVMREWYMLAQVGKHLQELEQAGYKSVNPVLLIGSLHAQTLPNKLKAIGVKSSINLPRMLAEGKANTVEVPFDFVEAVGSCAVKAKLP